MRAVTIAAVLGALPFRILASSCGTGMSPKEPDQCCEVDETTCLGWLFSLSGSSLCPDDHYYDTTKNGDAAGDDAVAACCTAKATCADATCTGGMTKKSDVDAEKCVGGADTCSATCCEYPENSCVAVLLTAGYSCTGDQIGDPSKYADDVGDNATATCCMDKPTPVPPAPPATPAPPTPCSATTCGAGYKKAVLLCFGGPDTCGGAPCCEWDDVCKKSQNTISCGSDKYYDTTKDTDPVGDDAVAACCTAKPTCADATCIGGMTKKSDVDAEKCSGGPDTCLLDCCEWPANSCYHVTMTGFATGDHVCTGDQINDPSKQGDDVGDDATATCCMDKPTPSPPADDTLCSSHVVNCEAGMFQDPGKGSVVFTDKKTDCCTAKATCGVSVSGGGGDGAGGGDGTSEPSDASNGLNIRPTVLSLIFMAFSIVAYANRDL